MVGWLLRRREDEVRFLQEATKELATLATKPSLRLYVVMPQCDEQHVAEFLGDRLQDCTTSLTQKYRILFALKGMQGISASTALTKGLRDPSALFRHEVAYCLGQRCNSEAVELLSKVIDNREEHSMVRHEAGEALGAIGTPECIAHLRRHQNDGCLEVAQTCQLALQRIDFYNSEAGQQYKNESRYLSVDPAPALPAITPIHKLTQILVDETADIFERYRALFALRNAGSQEAVRGLAGSFRGKSALLKHEVAYVLGQIQDKSSVATLREVLCDCQESAMVRHEAAEALGAIADPECVQLLKEFSRDAEPIVADSCIVALDMLEHELSGDFEYVDTGRTALKQ